MFEISGNSKNFYCLKKKCLDFPGNPAVKTPRFHCWRHGV